MVLKLPKQHMAQHMKVEDYPSMVNNVTDYYIELVNNALSSNENKQYVIIDNQSSKGEVHIGHITNLMIKDVHLKRLMIQGHVAHLCIDNEIKNFVHHAEKFGMYISVHDPEYFDFITDAETIAPMVQDRTCKYKSRFKMDRRSSLFYDKNASTTEKSFMLYDKYGPDIIRMCALLSTDNKCLKLSEVSIEQAFTYVSKIRNYTRYLVNNLYLEKHDPDNVLDQISFDMKQLIKRFDYLIELSEYDKAVKILVSYLSNYSAKLDADFKKEFYEMDLTDPIRRDVEDEFYYIATEIQKILFCILPFLSTELKLKLSK